jgi:hypothetical protein
MEWITTDEVKNEIWRRVSEYANTEIAYQALIDRHGEPGGHKRNYEKQVGKGGKGVRH